MARESRERFLDRNPVYYLEALAVTAWLEKKKFGRYTAQTEHDLQLFDSFGAHGLKVSLTAQGFLA